MADSRQRVALMQRNMRDGSWYEIQNKGSRAAKIRLYDEIGFFGTTAKDFVDELDALDVDSIELHINSVGGEVNDAVAIMNSLHDHPARITTIIDGVAASSASFIAMAGDEVVMNRNSEIMVHEPFGLAMGNSNDMKDLASRLDKEGDRIASIYAKKSGTSVAEWRDIMRAETWFSAEEAVEAKLADRVADTDGTEAKNRYDFAIFNYAGRVNAPKPPIFNQKTPAATVDGQTKQKGQAMSSLMETLRQELGIADENADEATVLAAFREALAEQAEPVPQPQNSAAAPELKNMDQLKALAQTQGAVILDQGIWEETQRQIQEGVVAAKKLREQERDLVLDKAIEDGRIPPANRAHWAKAYDADPKGIGEVIGSLKKNLIPVAAMGYAIEDDSDDLGEFASLFPKGA